jgi:hypothetical protein
VRLVLAEGRAWTPAMDKHLRIWKKQIEIRQRGHRKYAGRCKFRHRMLGISNIVVSAIVSTAIFSTFRTCKECDATCDIDQWIRFVNGFFSIIGIILSGFQNLFMYEKKAENHKKASDEYERLIRLLESILRQPPYMRGGPGSVMNTIREKYDDVTKSSPSLPSKYAQILGHRHKPSTVDSSLGDVAGRGPPKPEDVESGGIDDINDLRAILKDTKGCNTNIYPDIGFNLDMEAPDRVNMEYELERLHAGGSARKGPSLLTRALGSPKMGPATHRTGYEETSRGNDSARSPPPDTVRKLENAPQ